MYKRETSREKRETLEVRFNPRILKERGYVLLAKHATLLVSGTVGINIFLLYVVKPTMMNTGKKATSKKQGKKATETQNINYGICICRICCRDGDNAKIL